LQKTAEVETERGMQHFKDFATLRSAADAKNGRADDSLAE
jgi:hypothetical protein